MEARTKLETLLETKVIAVLGDDSYVYFMRGRQVVAHVMAEKLYDDNGNHFDTSSTPTTPVVHKDGASKPVSTKAST